jgi:glycosyltransferase involved in cell wall biosynthesis
MKDRSGMSGTQVASPRKVCYLAPDVPIPYPSGAAVHVAEVAASLNEMGHGVHVIARRTSYGEPKVETIDGVTIHRINRFILRPGGRRIQTYSHDQGPGRVKELFYYLYLRTLFVVYASLTARRVIRHYSLDVIIERETSFGAGGLASLLTGKPLILEIVGPRYSRLSVCLSSSILYYTESMLRGWVDKRKCVRVTAGVNPKLFRPSPDARKLIRSRFHTGDDIVVGYIGSFQVWHGVDAILHATSLLKERGTKVALLLVGPSFEPYAAIARALGISERCKFVGPAGYREVPAYINACDIMVAPYDPSKDPLRKKFGIGSPIKVLEYMACEKPVITTSVPPIDSMLGNLEALVMVEPGDAASLANALEGLIRDPKKAARMARIGNSLVAEKYSWTFFTHILSSQIAGA